MHPFGSLGFIGPCSRQSFSTTLIGTDQMPNIYGGGDFLGMEDGGFNFNKTLVISFQKMRAEYHSRSDRVTLMDLINALGGGLGLFLGLSLLSILKDIRNFVSKTFKRR